LNLHGKKNRIVAAVELLEWVEGSAGKIKDNMRLIVLTQG